MVEPDDVGRPDEQVREEAIAWLVRLRDSSDVQDHEAFTDWYSADSRHADIYDEVVASWDRTGPASLTPAGEAYRQGMLAKKAKPGRFMMLAAVSCILIALVLVCLHALNAAGNPKHADEIASGIGETRTLALPDGSKVTLDASSVVIVDYNGHQRHLRLQRGRARFDVAHDPAHPFIVSAGNGDVIAHGTIFDVDLQGQKMTVSLLRGSVEVKRHRDSREGQFLVPGQSASVDGGGPSRPAPVSANARDWSTGALSFSNAELSEVALLANRHAAKGILIIGPDARQLKFTGTVKAGDGTRRSRFVGQVQRVQSRIGAQVENRFDIGIFDVPARSSRLLGFDVESLDNVVGVRLNLDRFRNALSTGQEAKRPERPELREQQDAQLPERIVAIQIALFAFAIPVICPRAALTLDIGKEFIKRLYRFATGIQIEGFTRCPEPAASILKAAPFPQGT